MKNGYFDNKRRKEVRNVDFVEIIKKIDGKGNVIISPLFKVGRVKDLMTRGKDFYAVWSEEKKIWSKDPYDLIDMVDKEIKAVVNDMPPGERYKVRYMYDYSSNAWSDFIKYLKELPPNFHELDDKVTFLNQEVERDDYVSKRLKYDIDKDGDISAYDELMSTLYDEENREKLEWAIGCILKGDSIAIQKFIVLYGESGTGKSTVLNIIQKLFDGYWSIIDAKALTNYNDQFSLEFLNINPLVAIEHDTDLSRIEDNTKLNSLVSHETMKVNEKFKAKYEVRPRSFLFLGTNKPVKITDSKSGVIRRLIDVNPSGNLVDSKRYDQLVKEIDYEIGAIASHCIQVYEERGIYYYNDYRPTSMIFETNVFFNFVNDEIVYKNFVENDGTTLREAYQMYKRFCEEYAVEFKTPMYRFREELKSYFDEFYDRWNGLRSYYHGFKLGRVESDEESDEDEEHDWLELTSSNLSQFDLLYSQCKAQYANKYETPKVNWSDCNTVLKDIDTKELHYAKPPESHIVIDFDLTDEEGNKSLEMNLAEARKWPETYAEVSKSGNGLHLHYEYSGDVSKLAKLYSKGIEIKTFIGGASLRRKLSLCNNSPIKKIGSGLPLKGEKMVDFTSIQNEKMLRAFIKNCLDKKHHGATKPEVNFIYDELEKMYASGQHYDVTDMRPAIMAFANNSTNNASFCLELVSKMKWHSEENGNNSNTIEKCGEEVPIIFYDVEVFPNLFVICWKFEGEENKCNEMINPTPEDVMKLISEYRLIGFNNRRYDNHILYARTLGYTNEELYRVSQRIINNSENAFFREAYNISYTDIYDFASNANKMSLKKWEIRLHIHHQELGLPWDQPVDESMWETVADYCCNDVIATEAVFNHIQGDWAARKILAAISGLTYNDTTNTHSIKIIFGDNKHPQDDFNYVDLSEMFPGYKFENGKSTYQGFEVGEGGFVYAEPGMYGNVALLDVASMHPSSIEALELFGQYYTERFSSLKQGRIFIKHGEFQKLGDILDGKMKPFADELANGTAEFTAKDLSTALKTVINSVYGLTFAHFDNPCRDPRNIDNIVAKRGALFMVDLLQAVQQKGYIVAHIKTDSIKIPDADDDIIQFVMDFGKQYGYTFEHEATYDKMCLVNNAVYIAKYADGAHEFELSTGEKINSPWTATGAEFAEPYVYKTLFSHSDINVFDMAQTKLSKKGDIYIDMNEGLGEDEHNYVFVGKAGSFLPIKEGFDGGELFVLRDDKYNYLPGTKGYRWLETELVVDLHKEDDIDELKKDMEKTNQENIKEYLNKYE